MSSTDDREYPQVPLGGPSGHGPLVGAIGFGAMSEYYLQID